MSTQFLSKLSQNYTNLLNDDEYYNITIEVGEDPNVKIFRAHMSILCCRSPYIRRALATNTNHEDYVMPHIKLPKTSPEIFQIILKYIYGGVLSLNEQNNSEILKVLVAADKLLLQELTEHLQDYLIKNKSEWLEQHFELNYRTSFESNNLLELQQFCVNLMAKSPDRVFKSFDFTSLPEKSLVQLIKNDELQMEEVEVWKHVLEWGLAQNPTLLPDPDTWSDDDFKAMKNTLQHCLPLVRFFCFSSTDFSKKVRPYKKLLKHQLFEDLLDSYLDTSSEPSDDILPPRIMGIVDSKIVNLGIVSTISKRIDNLTSISNFDHLRYLPYKFELLLRGSRDGFTPKKFHELCDSKSNTVTFIKIKGSEEIIGGYNPLTWGPSWGKTKDSFIFSFKDTKKFKDAILSNVEYPAYAINYSGTYGPVFGGDIYLIASSDSTDYNFNYCVKKYYEKTIRTTEDKFSIRDYEVFQVVKR